MILWEIIRLIIGWTASGFTSKFLMQAGFMTGFMVYPKMNIDLVDIARSTIPVERSGMNYKFATISNICKVPVSTSADRPVSSHDAADDVFAYIDIFNKLYPILHHRKRYSKNNKVFLLGKIQFLQKHLFRNRSRFGAHRCKHGFLC